MRQLARLTVIMLVLAALIAATGTVQGTTSQQGTAAPTAYAEAIGQANLRSGPGIEYLTVGEITTGTQYPILAEHTLVPWLLIEFPGVADGAWVYTDLVAITGSLSNVPKINEIPPVNETPQSRPNTPIPPTAAASPTPDAPPAAPDTTPGSTPVSASPTPTLTPTPTHTPTVTPAGAIATTIGETNVRFGPDVSYPAIASLPAGASYPVLTFHALVPWVEIALPESPTNRGWVYRDIIEITGDTSQVAYTNATDVGYPTLTPTPQTVIVSGSPWDDAPAPSGALVDTLGEPLHNYLLEQGFAPYSKQMASVFVLDLQSGDTFTLNGDVAYSGMSLTKIPILATYFQRHEGPLSYDDAFLIADTMMCSENITTNQLLGEIGDGDQMLGSSRVTLFMQSLGLTGSFITRPYVLRDDEPPIAAETIVSGADQSSTRPDLYNQIVPEELGWLLAGIYQCAENESGLLMERYPNDFDAQECRQMLAAMDANAIGVFLEAGTPPNATVIHKHGWINDTHGDAGIVIGPDSVYVMVITLYGDTWLEFELTARASGELSRLAWNTFNPDAPLAAVAERIVPDTCDPRTDPVMDALMANSLPAPGP